MCAKPKSTVAKIRAIKARGKAVTDDSLPLEEEQAAADEEEESNFEEVRCQETSPRREDAELAAEAEARRQAQERDDMRQLLKRQRSQLRAAVRRAELEFDRE